jgi:predicted RND superfamily exporter protein
MSTMVLANSAMYFIALIIVQCILMGSMVDYGILFTNYYIEVRKEYAVEEALPEVLKRSIRAIATSAVILILITFSCGIIMEGAVSSILTTLGIGSTSALILVIFVLPSLLAIFDKCIIKKKKETEVCEQMKMQIK